MRNFLALTNFVSFWCGPPVTSSSVAVSPEPPPPAQHLHGGGRLRFQGTWVLATLAGWANKETGDSAIPYSQGWGADLGGGSWVTCARPSQARQNWGAGCGAGSTGTSGPRPRPRPQGGCGPLLSSRGCTGGLRVKSLVFSSEKPDSGVLGTGPERPSSLQPHGVSETQRRELAQPLARPTAALSSCQLAVPSLRCVAHRAGEGCSLVWRGQCTRDSPCTRVLTQE